MDFPLPRDTVPAIFQHRMLQWLHLQRDMGFAEQIRLLLERLRNISFGASGVVPELSCDPQIAPFGAAFIAARDLLSIRKSGKLLSLLGLDN